MNASSLRLPSGEKPNTSSGGDRLRRRLPWTGGGMADVASDVGLVGAYEDMASWVTVALENAGKQYL